MEITINVYKASVTYLARMAVAYVGAKSGDYERLLVTDSEREMTEKLWEEARTDALSMLKCLRMDASAADAAVVSATVTVPATYPQAGASELQLWLNQYFTHSMSASWLAMAGRSEAQRELIKAEAALRTIMAAASPRRRHIY